MNDILNQNLVITGIGSPLSFEVSLGFGFGSPTCQYIQASCADYSNGVSTTDFNQGTFSLPTASLDEPMQASLFETSTTVDSTTSTISMIKALGYFLSTLPPNLGYNIAVKINSSGNDFQRVAIAGYLNNILDKFSINNVIYWSWEEQTLNPRKEDFC
jgi:hypothetical protein